MKQLYALLLFLVLAIPVSATTIPPPAPNGCFANVYYLPATCNGNITSDTWDTCRTIVCEQGSSSLQVMACDKPNQYDSQYYELYRQASAGTDNVQICVGDTCLNNLDLRGFQRSDFPVCNETNTTPVCGNGIVESGEQCDGSAPTGYTCSSTCMLEAVPTNNTNDTKLTICHYPPGNEGNPQTITIDESAWPAHQAHNDTLGACPVVVEEQQVTICHHPPGNEENVQTITVGESAVPAHMAHGDTLGACQENETQPAEASISIAPWYPQGGNYVFVCNIAADSYDWYFGDGYKLLNTTHQDVYHTYEPGSYTVSCSGNGQMATLDVTVE